MTRLAALLFGLLVLASAAQAQPIQLFGTAGKAPVFLDISRVGDTVSGWYVYLKSGRQLRLEGKLDPKGFFQIEAFAPETNARAGLITGRRKDGHWTELRRNPRLEDLTPITVVQDLTPLGG